MQWKLPQASRLTEWLHRVSISVGFPWIAYIATRWPRGLLLFGARIVIFFAMLIYPRPKREIARNLSRVLGHPPRSREIRRAVREMLRHFAFYWVDLFRFAQLPAEEARRHLVSVEGMEPVEALVDAGQGVVLLTAHLGNWELGGVLLGQRDLPVSIVYFPDKFEGAERFRSSLRVQAGVEEIPLRLDSAWSSLPVLRALRDGRMVAMQGDRDFEERGVEAPFFGASVKFPRGPFMVALLTGAPIVPTFVTYTPGYDFQAHFGAPLQMVSTGDREADINRGVQEWAVVLEDVIRRHATQWYTFYDYWAGTSDLAAPAPEGVREVVS
ncbi:MAG: hypothetical protein K8J08_17215 [Thermoanaerobaculia bacterium]|nr:hypothetical protein [Thermoanaerobaculia bacterium]